MLGKTILATPLTQSAEAVKQLIEFVIGEPCRELPTTFTLANGAQLTKSNKGDAYYVTTPTACSCPARTYHPDQPCKHMVALLASNSKDQARAYQARQRELRARAKAGSSLPEPQESSKRLARPPEDSIKPEGKWPGGHNGPVEDDIKAVA